jgi:hypothetical protein
VVDPSRAGKDDALLSAEDFRKGLAFIYGNPLRFMTLGAKKTGYLYGLEIRELTWGYSKNYFGRIPAAALIPAMTVILLSFPTICILALSGVWRGSTYSRRPEWLLLLLVILYFTMAHFITFGESRFHLPLIPVLALFAGRITADRVLRWKREKAVTTCIAIIFAIMSINWFLHLKQKAERLEKVMSPYGNRAELPY